MLQGLSWCWDFLRLVPTPPPTPTEVRSFPPPLTSASAQPQTRRTSIDDDARGQQHVAPGNSDIRADDAEASEVDAASPSWTQRGSPVEEMNSWKCQQCQKTFTQRILLQMHVCPCQPNRPYQCGRCSLSFANPSDLRAHVVSHVNEKPFKCGFCARAFAGATTLNNHIRTHTGQRPFNCDQCGKTFSQASMLARHQRNPGECIKAVPNGPNDAQQPWSLGNADSFKQLFACRLPVGSNTRGRHGLYMHWWIYGLRF